MNRKDKKGKKNRRIKFNHPKEMETDLISCAKKSLLIELEMKTKKRVR